MLDVAKMDVTLPPLAVAEDIQLGALLAACDVQPTAPLAFAYELHTGFAVPRERNMWHGEPAVGGEIVSSLVCSTRV